ncbi:unnamed protein product [Choristocarpus tenellus]
MGEGRQGQRPLFSQGILQELNPLAISIRAVTGLPGVRVSSPSMQKNVKPTPFSLLQRHCKPVYVVCRRGGGLHSRVLWTGGQVHSKSASFRHTSAFLLGQMDRHWVEEWVETTMLQVELHDR